MQWHFLCTLTVTLKVSLTKAARISLPQALQCLLRSVARQVDVHARTNPNTYNLDMSEPTRNIRVKRLHEIGKDVDLESTTPGERLSMMWQLTLDAWAFKGETLAEHRLPRYIVRLHRGGR